MQDFINDALIEETLAMQRTLKKAGSWRSLKRQRGFMDFLLRKRQYYFSVRTMIS